MRLIKLFILLFIFSCQSPYQKGEKLFSQHCSNCHGAEAEGFRKLYPPITKDLYSTYSDKIVCIIRYGLNDSLVYNGIQYSSSMPGNDILSDIDIVNLKNYLDWKFLAENKYNSLPQVKKELVDCK